MMAFSVKHTEDCGGRKKISSLTFWDSVSAVGSFSIKKRPDKKKGWHPPQISKLGGGGRFSNPTADHKHHGSLSYGGSPHLSTLTTEHKGCRKLQRWIGEFKARLYFSGVDGVESLTANSACCHTWGEWCRLRCHLQSLICRWISSSRGPSAPLVPSWWGPELPLCTWHNTSDTVTVK